MRNSLVIGVIFSSVLLHAQSVTKGSSITLEAHNETAGAMSAPGSSSPATDVPTISHPVRISTGVVWPRLISEPAFKISQEDLGANPELKHVIVSFRVDESGKPENIRLTQSVNPTVDQRVMRAVSQYRYLPATLNGQKVAVNVNLQVNFATR